MCNVLFVVMEALLQAQCQEHPLLPAPPSLQQSKEMWRVALLCKELVVGCEGEKPIAGEFILNEGVQSFMFSVDSSTDPAVPCCMRCGSGKCCSWAIGSLASPWFMLRKGKVLCSRSLLPSPCSQESKTSCR